LPPEIISSLYFSDYILRFLYTICKINFEQGYSLKIGPLP
jgi:hypothetical protein